VVKRIVIYTLIIIFLIAGYFLIFNKILAGSILPRVYCCNTFNIGYLKKDQAQDLLNIFAKKIERDNFIFYAKTPQGEKQVEIDPHLIALQDPDLSRSLIDFKVKETIDLAYQIGRKGSILDKLKAVFESYFKKKNVNFIVELNQDELKKILQRKFQLIEKEPINPGFKWQNKKIVLTQAKPGFSLDYDKAIKSFYNDLKLLKNTKQELKFKKKQPNISDKEKNSLLEQVKDIVKNAPYQIFYKEDQWDISALQLVDWLYINSQPNPGLSFKEEKVKKYLKEKSKIINIPPQKGRLEIKDGKVVEFLKKKKGQLVNVDKTFSLLLKNILKQKKRTEFFVETVDPPALPEDLDSLGIEKLIAKGQSDFSGSPQNRRHNIRIGAEKLHGLLIKPDQEFSLVEALGPVDKEHGFLPELVIKEDRTIPEYGGGLCQIATTAFRVALHAGLSITERQNHSYRVHYYEPPVGMDATIYIPRPDFRFINDMDHYLLLQAEIKGNNLIFKLYGTPDGRKVTTGKPKVFNITEPGPPKIVETNQLPPGERKKLESSHKGAEAVFTNTVIFANGIKRERRWKSYYKAWPEVWLVGEKQEDNKKNNEN